MLDLIKLYSVDIMFVCTLFIFWFFLIACLIARKLRARNIDLNDQINSYSHFINTLQAKNNELVSWQKEFQNQTLKFHKEIIEKNKIIEDMNETLVRNQRVLKERKKKIDCQRKIISNRDKKILKLTSKKNAN